MPIHWKRHLKSFEMKEYEEKNVLTSFAKG